MNAAAELGEAIERGAELDPRRLERLFDQLAPVEVEAMIGSWRGGAFETASQAAEMLTQLGWHGKRFEGLERVEPLICRGEDGETYAFRKLGAARLRAVEFRGVLSAAMVYDTQPIIDYFRRLDDDRLIGVMDTKGQPIDFYFWLERE